nr:hypothetical protein [Tanacetum cinerariifolium]
MTHLCYFASLKGEATYVMSVDNLPSVEWFLWEVVMHDAVYPNWVESNEPGKKINKVTSCQFTSMSPTQIYNAGDDTVMVVQMVAALCALQTQLLEYNSSCEVSNPNELTHLRHVNTICYFIQISISLNVCEFRATIKVDASAPLDME